MRQNQKSYAENTQCASGGPSSWSVTSSTIPNNSYTAPTNLIQFLKMSWGPVDRIRHQFSWTSVLRPCLIPPATFISDRHRYHCLYSNPKTQQPPITQSDHCNQAACVTETEGDNDAVHHEEWYPVQQQPHWDSQQLHDLGTDPETFTWQQVGRTIWTSKDNVTGQAQLHMAFNDGLCAQIHQKLWFISKSQITHSEAVWHTRAAPSTSRTIVRHQLQFPHMIAVV